MSLDMTDIQEVMHEVTESKLVPVAIHNDPISNAVNQLVKNAGDVTIFTPKGLFEIEQALANPFNKELRTRWNKAIRLNATIRMHFLRDKALTMLERFNDETKAPINAFCKIVLSDILSEGTERIKAKYAYRPKESNTDTDEDDEADDIADQLDKGED